MWSNPQEAADFVTFTEKILNGKLHFLCSDGRLTIGHSCNFFLKASLLTFNYLEHLNYWMAKNVGITPHNMLGFLQLLFLKEDDQVINSTMCDMENNRWNILACLPSSTFVIILTPKICSFFKFAWLRIWILRAI